MAGNTLTDTGDGWILEAQQLFEQPHLKVNAQLGCHALLGATSGPLDVPKLYDALSLFDISI